MKSSQTNSTHTRDDLRSGFWEKKASFSKGQFLLAVESWRLGGRRGGRISPLFSTRVPIVIVYDSTSAQRATWIASKKRTKFCLALLSNTMRQFASILGLRLTLMMYIAITCNRGMSLLTQYVHFTPNTSAQLRGFHLRLSMRHSFDKFPLV